MNYTYTNMINMVQDDDNPLLLEDYIKSTFVQPLAYYNGKTLTQAIDEVLKVGTGVIEVAPSDEFDRAYYVVIRQLMNGDMMVNVLTYASDVPSSNNTRRRPFVYDGSIEWKPGDTVYSTDPVSTKCYGWVCVKAGVPGTWHPFGRLAPWSSMLETVDELPTATKEQEGRQVISNGRNGKPATYICTAFQKEDGSTEYRWISSEDDIPPYYISMATSNADGVWELDSIHGVDVTESSDAYKSKLPRNFAILFRAPENSEIGQKLKIGSTEYSMKFMSGRGIEKADIIAGTTVIAQIDTATESLTLMGSSSLKYRDRISPFFLSESEMDSGRWRITKIGDIVATYEGGQGYREGLPGNIAVLFRVPANAVTGQSISIGSDNFTVTFADGTSVQENDLKENVLVMAFIDIDRKHVTLEGTGKSYKTYPAVVSSENGAWKVEKIGGYRMDSYGANIQKFIGEPFKITFTAPSDSVKKQKIVVENREIFLRCMDEDYLFDGDIAQGSLVTLDIEFTNSDSKSFVEGFSGNHILTVTAIAEQKTGNIWDITYMNGEEVEDEWKRQAILSFTAPSDSTDSQKIRIFHKDFVLQNFPNKDNLMAGNILQGTPVMVFISPKEGMKAQVLPLSTDISVRNCRAIPASETGLPYADQDSLVMQEISGIPLLGTSDCERAFGDTFLLQLRLEHDLKSRFLHIGKTTLEMKYADGTWVHDNEVLRENQVLLILVNIIGSSATLLFPAPPTSRIYGVVSTDGRDWVLERIMSSQKVLWDKSQSGNTLRDSTKTFMFNAPSDSNEAQKLILNNISYSMQYFDGFAVHAGDIAEDAPVPVYLDTVFAVAYIQSSRPSAIYRGEVEVLPNGKWDIVRLEGKPIDEIILQNTFTVAIRVPENSSAEQIVEINGNNLPIYTSNGIRILANSLAEGTLALLLVDMDERKITVPSGGSSSGAFFSAELSLTDDKVWVADAINGQSIVTEADFARAIGNATRFSLLMRTPASTINHQVLQIAATSYPLKNLDGEYVARHDVPGNSLIIVNFDADMPYGVISTGGTSASVTEANVYYQRDELGQSRRIEFSESMQNIRESFADGSVKETIFNEDGSITEKMTYYDGTMASKNIVFNSDGSITETVTGKLSPSKAGSIGQFSNDEILAAFEDAVEQHQVEGVVTSSGPITQFTDADIEGAVRAALLSIRSGQQSIQQPND